ncbi:MAG: acyltransferase family protein [Sphingomonadaceae bacterium]|nr:acyltransferase family protein [Sphingomonadaceae bacterium]
MDHDGPSSRDGAPPSRHYGLDWLRIHAFLLLILYHAGLAFAPGPWVIKLAEVEWPAYPMLFLSSWRLALPFVIAGYASRTMLARLGDVPSFVRERTQRLLLPLLFAMAVLIPPQTWVRLREAHYGHDYSYFLAHDGFSFHRFHGVTMPAWEHLWFLFYLWTFTMALLAAAAYAPPGLRAWAAATPSWLAKGSRLLWAPLAYFAAARVGIVFTLGEAHGLFNDWLSDFVYLPCFLFGYALAGTPGLWPAIARLWRPALAVALASFAVMAAVEIAYPGESHPSHLAMAVDRAAMGAMLWSMTLVMLHLAGTLLNRDHRWRRPLAEAVFPAYIVHQTIIVLVAWWLQPLALPPGPAFAIVVVATAAGCWLFWRLGRAAGSLRPLLGLGPQPAARHARVGAEAV